jgi:hypothetical protein
MEQYTEITVKLIDSILSISACVLDRLMVPIDINNHKVISEALDRLRNDSNLNRLRATAPSSAVENPPIHQRDPI